MSCLSIHVQTFQQLACKAGLSSVRASEYLSMLRNHEAPQQQAT